jgi:hydroxymethylbilane synthase
MRIIRIGTRGSTLALLQTEMVRTALARLEPGITTQVCTFRTTGDIHSDVPLDAIGGKGVFVKEIERKLLDREIDCAVHSLKDMQAVLPDGLAVSAFLERDDPRDMLFSAGGHTLQGLPSGARLGTSSMRRRCQVRIQRPDLTVVDIRGNVPTRLGKIGSAVDAVILAAAGVRRLGLEEGVALDAGSMVPSPGQGIIAVEARNDDHELNALLGQIDHEPSRICAEAERSFLAALGQDCNLPAGAYATWNGDTISILGMLGSPDETRLEKMHMQGTDTAVGRRLALALKEKVHPEDLP